MNSFRKILLKFAEYKSNLRSLRYLQFFFDKFCMLNLNITRHHINTNYWKIFKINKGLKKQKIFNIILNFDIKIRNASKWSSGYQRLGRFRAVSLSVVVHASSRAQRKDHLDPRWSPHAH